jgi:signal transduction histidine kinase/ligand-binding sensor domain-containing protein
MAFISLTLISSVLTVPAQSQFDIWNTDTGLPQNTIQDIHQTRDGYLWVATSDGLVRFDGAQFTVFNSGNSPGLKSNRFTTLFEDQEAVLWIGTEDAGLAKYEGGRFTTYTVADGLLANRVWRIFADPLGKGQLLIMTAAGVMRWPDKMPLPHAPAGRGASGFRLLQDGSVWSNDSSHLYRVKDGVETAYALGDGSLSAGVTAVYQDAAGSVWIATGDARVRRLKGGRFKSYTAKDGLPESKVTIFYEDRVGRLWMGTDSAGLVRISHSNDDTSYEAAPPNERVRVYTTAQGLPSNTIRAIYQDAEGSIWVGTFASGMGRLRKQIITTYSERDGLGGDNVYPIFQDSAGNVWIGSWGAGLTVYRDGASTRYPLQSGLPCGNLVTALAEDREGRVWVGTYDGACWFKDGKFNAFTEKLDLKGGGLDAIFQDSRGRFWFGTELAGLYRYHDGALSHFTSGDELPSDSVRAIIEDRQGNIWIATYGGLVRFKDEGFTVYTTRDGLASDRLRSLYLDAQDTLWIGTYDGGLSRYKEGRFTSYTTRDGLFNGGAFQILEDDRENLWISCNLGIYRLSKRELNDFADGKIQTITSVVYGKQDGMLNVECNGGTQPAGTRTRDGRLWFPTQQGAAVIDPRDIQPNPVPPPVVIESALVDRAARDLRQPLRLEPGQTNLEIHYTGLSFIKPERVRFRYRLEGVDKEWIEAGNRRVAYYSHLRPGTYTFTVVAANSDGVWNTVGRQLTVVVIPPFWQRWWFIAFVLLAVAGLAALFYLNRARRWRRAREAQEAFSKQLIESQEQERQRIAAELHDSLGQNLLIIKNRALFGALKPEDREAAKAQFDEISTSATRAIEEVREIAYDLRPYHLDRLGLTTTIKAMVQKVAAASEIDFSTHLDSIDGLLTPEAEITLYRVLQEGVSNVVRHSKATRARVEVRRRGRKVVITVWDNGQGLGQGVAAAEPGRGGFGLVGISERVRILGGTHTIRSSPGQGTTIVINLELPDGSTGGDPLNTEIK